MEGKNQWWLVAAAAVTVFMAALDISIVAVALPSIEDTFGTHAAVTEWVALAYLLPLIALALPSGRWLDRVGRRSAMLLLVSGFAITSALAGAAPWFELLVAARVAQGAFGAALFALVPVVAATAVAPRLRGRAFGVVAAVGPLGAVTGPAVGGLLTEHLDWRWVFYVNVPVSLVVMLVVVATMAADGRLRLPDRWWLLESLLLSAAAGAVLLALPGLLVWRRLPVSRGVRNLVRTPRVAGTHVALAAFAAAGIGLQYLLPFFLREVTGLSPAEIGLTVLALPATMVLLSPVCGLLADRVGAWQVGLVGAAVLMVGVALLSPLRVEWGAVAGAWRLAVVGLGTAMTTGPLVALAMSLAPRPLLATVGAATSLARNVGFALGPAMLIGTWAAAGYTLAGMRAAVTVAVGAAIIGGFALAGRRREPVRPGPSEPPPPVTAGAGAPPRSAPPRAPGR
jgi:MFS family permease